jgi:hypothetical protein
MNSFFIISASSSRRPENDNVGETFGDFGENFALQIFEIKFNLIFIGDRILVK